MRFKLTGSPTAAAKGLGLVGDTATCTLRSEAEVWLEIRYSGDVYSCALPATPIENGQCVVLSRHLRTLMRHLDEPPYGEFVLDDNRLRVTGRFGEMRMSVAHTPNEQPFAPPRRVDATLDLSSVPRVAGCASQDPSAGARTGVHFQDEFATASDGYRAARYHLNGALPTEFIVSTASLRIAAGLEQPLGITTTSVGTMGHVSSVTFTATDASFTTATIQGGVPSLDRFFTTEPDGWTVQTAALRQIAQDFIDCDGTRVHLEFDGGNAVSASFHSDELNLTLSTYAQGSEAWDVRLRTAYLVEALGVIDDEWVHLSPNRELGALLLRSGNLEQLVMPLAKGLR